MPQPRILRGSLSGADVLRTAARPVSARLSVGLSCLRSIGRRILNGTRSSIYWAAAEYYVKTASALICFTDSFDDEVEAGAPTAPMFSATAASLPAFQLTSTCDVVYAISQLHDKCCASNPQPTYFLKVTSDQFLAAMFNWSLMQSGRLPALIQPSTPLRANQEVRP